jgi:hypothetical protein
LVESSCPDAEATQTVQGKLAEVRYALARLPLSGEPLRRMRSAG